MSDRVRQAFRNTPPLYLQSVLDQRASLSGKAQGSIYPSMTPRALLGALMGCEWLLWVNDQLKAPAVAFVTRDLGGLLGMIDLASLCAEATLLGTRTDQIYLRLDDAKQTGGLSLVTERIEYQRERPRVDFTVVLLGPDDEGPHEIVWTLHPGDPVAPSTFKPTGRYQHGAQITLAEALELGFTKAKIKDL